MITKEQLRKIMPRVTDSRASLFVPQLNEAMLGRAINTPRRQAAFLAQIALESGQLQYTTEIASGKAYEGRKDLGNTTPGDGVKYKGRGLIQLTGRNNYALYSAATGIDFMEAPVLLACPEHACKSAAWFWQVHGLNELADAEDFLRITKRINGGTNGLADRHSFWERAKKVLGA